MMWPMRRLLLAILLSLSLPLGLRAASGPGTSGADLLANPPGVRPAAMAGAYGSFGDDVYVIGYNPAGLTRIAKFSLGLDHLQAFSDVQTESLSLAVPTHRYGVLGFQVIYRHMPTIQNILATDPPVNASDFLLTVATAHRWGRFSLGGALKTLESTLADKKALTNAIDIGAQYLLGSFQTSFVLQNLGPPVKYLPNPQDSDPLPLAFRLGISRPILATPKASLLAAFEAAHVRDEGFQQAIGVEYWHQTLIAIRAGYRNGNHENLSTGFTAGAAIRNSLGRLEYELGYTWRPSHIQSGFTVNSHLFGLLIWY